VELEPGHRQSRMFDCHRCAIPGRGDHAQRLLDAGKPEGVVTHHVLRSGELREQARVGERDGGALAVHGLDTNEVRSESEAECLVPEADSEEGAAESCCSQDHFYDSRAQGISRPGTHDNHIGIPKLTEVSCDFLSRSKVHVAPVDREAIHDIPGERVVVFEEQHMHRAM
jgi:hypothetical protein